MPAAPRLCIGAQPLKSARAILSPEKTLTRAFISASTKNAAVPGAKNDLFAILCGSAHASADAAPHSSAPSAQSSAPINSDTLPDLTALSSPAARRALTAPTAERGRFRPEDGFGFLPFIRNLTPSFSACTVTVTARAPNTFTSAANFAALIHACTRTAIGTGAQRSISTASTAINAIKNATALLWRFFAYLCIPPAQARISLVHFVLLAFEKLRDLFLRDIRGGFALLLPLS